MNKYRLDENTLASKHTRIGRSQAGLLSCTFRGRRFAAGRSLGINLRHRLAD